ncbi:hypothetical protein GMRT_12201 [Giardia muris]|uniref:Uncharacterized protein n=1 Tax=Giardia muris TaxID=5742 RepID=A0A4Z1T5K6_GIAMU|nr:hypothetical protein GMRT_12201 [Giardia muris]|eukprot:TNJ27809.1 hypothetical protein GMRT_12201 [Giardia muris]
MDIFFQVSPLDPGYTHDPNPVEKKFLVISGYDANNELFLEQRQVFTTTEASRPKRKRRAGVIQPMHVAAPRFPRELLDIVSQPLRHDLELYLGRIPRGLVPTADAPLESYCTGNLADCPKGVPTCADIARNPMDLLATLLNKLDKGYGLRRYEDAYAFLVLLIQTPYVPQVVDCLISALTRSPCLRVSTLKEAKQRRDEYAVRCLQILSSEIFLKPLVTSLARIVPEGETARNAPRTLQLSKLLITQYVGIVNIGLVCDAISVLFGSCVGGDVLRVATCRMLLREVSILCGAQNGIRESTEEAYRSESDGGSDASGESTLSGDNELLVQPELVASELSRAGFTKRLFQLFDRIARDPTHADEAILRNALAILLTLRASAHGAKNLPRDVFLQEQVGTLTQLRSALAGSELERMLPDLDGVISLVRLGKVRSH